MADVDRVRQSVGSMDVRVCPACGAVSSRETGACAPGFSVLIGTHEFQQRDYVVRECCDCGLLFRTPIPTPQVLSAYYSEVDFRKWEIPGHCPPERAALAVLRRLPQGSNLLDFGCSTGRLLASQVGSYDCSGFEIDARAALRAADSGLKMLPPEFMESRAAETFDGIVMMDVFEHLASPTAVLVRLSQDLKPGGILVIGTGNGDSPVCRLDPAQFWYFRNIEHLVMLTLRYANWLADKLGLTLEMWEHLCHYDHSLRMRGAQYLRHTAYWRFRQGSRLERSLMRLLPRVRRAEHWAVAPGFSASRDHVVAVLRKPHRTP